MLFVPFFYGAGYEKCVTLFYILLPSCLFLAVANVIRTQYLIPHCKDKIFVVSIVLGFLNFIINIALITFTINSSYRFLITMTVCIYQFLYVAYINIEENIFRYSIYNFNDIRDADYCIFHTLLYK